MYNAKGVFAFFAKEQIENKFSSEIEFQKYKQKKIAGNLAYNGKYAKTWINTFTSTHTSFYTLKWLTLAEKVKYSIVLFYSWVKSKIAYCEYKK